MKTIVNWSNQVADDDKYMPHIFLAGPTNRTLTYKDSWRNKAVEYITNLGFEGMVHVPEFKEGVKWDDRYIKQQTMWEWDCLGFSEVIMFWVPRDKEEMIGLTTNVEFGRYITLKPESVVLGYPEDAFRMRYLNTLYMHLAGKSATHTLAETCQLAVTLAENNFKNKQN